MMFPKKVPLLCLFAVFTCAFGFVFPGDAQTTVFDLGQVVVSEDEDPDEGLSIVEKMNIGQKTLKSHKVVDLAEILSDEMIEASMIRKSGYGNEVGLRGFTKSNLRFTLDDTLIEGSCGSRKDPPLSHINLLTVQKIEVKEGPYDVSVPGALGGDINVITKDTQKGFHGEVLSKFGSFDYLSQGGYVTGGGDNLQGLFGYNYSRSGQYEDGAGNKLSSFNPAYNSDGKNADSFSKNDFWGKVVVKPSKSEEFVLSSSIGKADEILTPRVAMDTENEMTYLNKAEYIVEDLGEFSKEFKVSGYYNRVEHYPYGRFRTGAINTRRIEAISYIAGAQIENVTPSDVALFRYGADFYFRNWYGDVLNRNTGAVLNSVLFPDVNEIDGGLYFKGERDIDNLSITAGVRADVFYTKAQEDLTYTRNLTTDNAETDFLPGGNLFLKYFLDDRTNVFGGVGFSNRTPTTVERYVQEGPGYCGNPDVKPSRNLETDIGIETSFPAPFKIKTKGFYSYLIDYIYQEQRTSGVKTYTNIDAYMIGGDMTLGLDAGHGFGLEGGAAYQRGRKLDQPENNSDKDLAEIAPLKAKIGATYEKRGFSAVYEWVCSASSKDVDRDAGETTLKGWDVFNLRAGYQFSDMAGDLSFLNGMSVNFGIDNMFNRKYAVANSYEYDPTDPAGANVRIVNEPGRFIYCSLLFVF